MRLLPASHLGSPAASPRGGLIAPGVTVHTGDSRLVLPTLPEHFAQLSVSSPPYFVALRDYGVARQLGAERTVRAYISHQVEVYSGVHRGLRDDGLCYVVIRDSYASVLSAKEHRRMKLTAKDLLGIPWRFALSHGVVGLGAPLGHRLGEAQRSGRARDALGRGGWRRGTPRVPSRIRSAPSGYPTGMRAARCAAGRPRARRP